MKADYVLALKGNQGTLREDVELFAAEQKAVSFKDAKVTRQQTVDGDHGRIETRTTTAIHDVGWLQQRHQWPGLQGVVMVESTREIANRIEHETRFYITSLAWLADQLGPVIRSHWAIENSLHWVMDMVFRDDECRVRTDQAPANFTTLKHMAHNLIRKAPGKDYCASNEKPQDGTTTSSKASSPIISDEGRGFFGAEQARREQRALLGVVVELETLGRLEPPPGHGPPAIAGEQLHQTRGVALPELASFSLALERETIPPAAEPQA